MWQSLLVLSSDMWQVITLSDLKESLQHNETELQIFRRYPGQT